MKEMALRQTRRLYRSFGERDLVPILSFGGSALGALYADYSGQEKAIEVVREAVNRGINVIDTAPWYGQGHSEEMIGRALCGMDTSGLRLHTKIGRYETDPKHMFDFSAKRVELSIYESMRRLGVDQLDLVQVHDPEFAPSYEVIVEETLPALHRLQSEGVIKRIGMTGYPLQVVKDIICKSDIIPDTVLTYGHMCLHDVSLESEGYINFFAQRGIGLIAGSPLSMGLLTEHGPPDWHPAGDALKHRCAEAEAFARTNGVSLARIALVFALSRPGIATTLSSAANWEIFEKTLLLAQGAEQEISPADPLRDVLEDHPLISPTGSSAEIDECHRMFAQLSRKERLVLAVILLHFFPHTLEKNGKWDHPIGEVGPVPSSLQTVMQVACAHSSLHPSTVHNLASPDEEVRLYTRKKIEEKLLSKLHADLPSSGGEEVVRSIHRPVGSDVPEAQVLPSRWWSWEGVEVTKYWSELGKALETERKYPSFSKEEEEEEPGRDSSLNDDLVVAASRVVL